MEFIYIFFLIITVGVLSYLATLFSSSSRRLPLVIEIFFVLVYGFVLLLVLFPEVLGFIEESFGIVSALNFIIYVSVFLAYFLILILYQKLQEQRVEISKLVREISYVKDGKKKK